MTEAVKFKSDNISRDLLSTLKDKNKQHNLLKIKINKITYQKCILQLTNKQLNFPIMHSCSQTRLLQHHNHLNSPSTVNLPNQNADSKKTEISPSQIITQPSLHNHFNQRKLAAEKENKSQEYHKKLKLKTITNHQKQTIKTSSSFSSFNQLVKKNCPSNKYHPKNSISSRGNLSPNTKKKVQYKNQNVYTLSIPNTVYFSLKSLKQTERASPQDTNQATRIVTGQTKSIVKEKHEIKNYPLSGLVSQIISKSGVSLGGQVYLKFWQVINTKLDYSQVMATLFCLGMTRYSSESKYNIQYGEQKEELQKIYQLWKILKSNRNNTNPTSSPTKKAGLLDLVIILAAILNIKIQSVDQLAKIFIQKTKSLHPQKTISPSIQSLQVKDQPSNIFFIRNKTLLSLPTQTYQGYSFLHFDAHSRNQISKQFQIFKINRLNSLNIKRTQKYDLNPSEQEFEIGSLISPKSKQLALNKRIKIIDSLKVFDLQETPSDKIQKLQADPTIFLNYKDQKKCQSKFKNDVNKIDNNSIKNKRSRTSIKTFQKVSKKVLIPSQKVKFSQMSAIQKMQKARQLKLQKQLIKQKGWTNSGKNELKRSQSQVASQTNSNRNKSINFANQISNKNRNQNNLEKRTFFQKRKQSLRGFRILQQKDSIGQVDSKDGYKDILNEELWNEYEKIEIYDTFQAQINVPSSCIKGNSDAEVFIEADESLDLENDSYQQQHHSLTKQNQTLSSLQNKASSSQNNRSFEQNEIIQIFPDEQPRQMCQNKSKTFIKENSSQHQLHSDTLFNTQSFKQTRVIKSYLKIPILYVDVNMDESKKERIVIFEDDDPAQLAQKFGKKHGLDMNMIQKLQEMLSQQIGGILGRIDEVDGEYQDTKDDVFDSLPTETR